MGRPDILHSRDVLHEDLYPTLLSTPNSRDGAEEFPLRYLCQHYLHCHLCSHLRNSAVRRLSPAVCLLGLRAANLQGRVFLLQRGRGSSSCFYYQRVDGCYCHCSALERGVGHANALQAEIDPVRNFWCRPYVCPDFFYTLLTYMSS